MKEHSEHGGHAPLGTKREVTPSEKRARAILSLLMDKGVVTSEEISRTMDELDSRSPAMGAKVVARAWVDPEFKSRLLTDAKSALAELGIDTGSLNVIVALENTETVHNVVVCTLCSCYPRLILGLPPAWYKSLEYRSRVVVDPRGVLKEFGLELESDVEARVYDSTADMRYLVIPTRPAGTERLSEEELADLVTRDSMIGLARARQPAEYALSE